jgi:uncharacterized phage infection (PIP) family protein YhgE
MARPTTAELQSMKDRLSSLVAESENILSTIKAASVKYETGVATIASGVSSATSGKDEIEDLKSQAEENSGEIQKLLKGANDQSEKIESFADKIDSLQSNLAAKETALKLLYDKATELKNTVQGLLPGATSAGLASAFRERKESYQKPIRFWTYAFMGSIAAMMIFAVFNPITFSVDQITEQNFYKYLLLRLPFIGPTIWFAIYAAKRHGQFLRLEEEYAHKEAVSKSFEGYKKQLMEIEASESDKASTESLITKALDAISLHPGRVYEQTKESITPFDAIKDLASLRRDKKDAVK